MPGTVETSDIDEIQDWIEERGGEPAVSSEGSGELRVDFGDKEDVKQILWPEFIEILEQEGLKMVYEQDDVAVSEDTSLSEEYEFVKKARDSPEDIPDTERDDDEVMDNMEETNLSCGLSYKHLSFKL